MYRYFVVSGQRFKVDKFTDGQLTVSNEQGVDLIILPGLDLWADAYDIKQAIRTQITETEF